MLTLVPGGMGGSETYARQLLESLGTSPSTKATAYVSSFAENFTAAVPEVVCSEVSGGKTNVARIKTLVQSFIHRGRLLKRMRGSDVFHVPFTVPLPKPSRRLPFVQTLLDMQHMDLPDLFTPFDKVYRKFYYDRAAKKADVVVTISEFAKQSIIDHLGIAPEKIFVAHLGVDAAEFTPNLGSRERFILYPARGWKHKNHAKLFEAMRILQTTNPDLRLILTGGALETLTDVPSNVEVRGLVSLAELRELYRQAACMVFPSLYEGFGLPPLEAMASGCPVASSTSGSLPEIVGNAAVTFDPLKPQDIAAAILQAIDSTEELQAAGLEQVNKFTWAHCAEVHEQAYRYAYRSRNQI